MAHYGVYEFNTIKAMWRHLFANYKQTYLSVCIYVVVFVLCHRLASKLVANGECHFVQHIVVLIVWCAWCGKF